MLAPASGSDAAAPLALRSARLLRCRSRSSTRHSCGVDPFLWTPTLSKKGVERYPYVEEEEEQRAPAHPRARGQIRGGPAGGVWGPQHRLSKELGIADSLIRTWVQRAEGAPKEGQKAGSMSESEREELSHLRREVKVLRMEREILKKAATFFAKENA